MTVIDRRTGAVIRRDPVPENAGKELARAFAAQVLPRLLREQEARRAGSDGR